MLECFIDKQSTELRSSTKVFEALYLTYEERGNYFIQALIGKTKILNDMYAKTGNELTTAVTRGTKLVTSTTQKTRLAKQRGKIKAKAKKQT